MLTVKIMNLPRTFVIAILLLSGNLALNAQDPSKAILVDEFGILCSEELMARYDSFLSELSSELSKDPNATGMIVLYGDKTSEGRNVNLFRYVSQFYPEMKQFKDRNLEFVRGVNQDETKLQFWIVPAGAESPRIVESHRPLSVTATTRYDVAAADLHRYDGKTHLYLAGFYEHGCDFPPYYFGFGDQLRKDRLLTGYIVVYTKFGTGARYGRRVATFAVNDLVKNSKIPRSRIKTIYGGNRNKPEIEFWLVPAGGDVPSVRPDREVKQE